MTEAAPRAAVRDLADGEWHRLHPASPLLRGGLVFLAVLGFVLANLRERVVEVFLLLISPVAPDAPYEPPAGWEGDWAEDPIGGIVVNGLIGWALAGLVVVIVLVIGGFHLAWRMHTFRVTSEALEVRSGILFRSHRSARLDRIQGINLNRPLFARLFGTAKLDVSVAGQSGNVDLSYLGSAQADRLRADLLRLASGARRAAASAVDAGAGAMVEPVAPGAPVVPGATDAEPAAPGTLAARAGGIVGRRVDEFLAPELDPSLAPPESVVRIPLARVIASALLGGSMIWFVVLVAIITTGVVSGAPWVLFTFVPAVIGLVSYLWSRITKSLRYSIAGTPDGVRIGSGLLSTANQTIPPGRVHAIEASQWLLWRPFGWWSMRVNVAGQSVSANGEGAQRTLVLPVGTADDVRRVVGLFVPDADAALGDLLAAGLTGSGPDTGYTPAPRSAAWIRPFSWRRIGLAAHQGLALLRRGWLVRSVVLVPLARMQSVAVSAGPVRRALGIASLRIHTVMGPVTAELPALERVEADAAFEALAAESVARGLHDRSDRWGEAAGGA